MLPDAISSFEVTEEPELLRYYKLDLPICPAFLG